VITLTNTWLNGTNGVLFTGARVYSQLGLAVNSAGDINRDGCDDILIGAGGENKAYMVYGRSNDFPALIMLTNTWCDGTNGVTLAGGGPSDACGSSLSPAGDVNGDGLPDFLVGADRASPGGRGSAGETYVVYGRTNALPAMITMTNTYLDGTNGVALAGAMVNDWVGCSVRSAGDMNKDGYDDLLIGAVYADPSGQNIAGETYLVYGGVLFDAVYIIPNSGPFAGGYQVTIIGSNLCDGFDITQCDLVRRGGDRHRQSIGDPGRGLGRSFRSRRPRRSAGVFHELRGNHAIQRLHLQRRSHSGDRPPFGPVMAGGKATNLFTVTNFGTEDLLITAVTNDGPGAAYFNVSALAGMTVAPETASNFPVVFTAGAAGTFTPTCYVANNCPIPIYSFGLTGSVFQISTNVGPYGGGNTITITNGHFGTITNVLVGGVNATITGTAPTG
jgi:hypothetical protein